MSTSPCFGGSRSSSTISQFFPSSHRTAAFVFIASTPSCLGREPVILPQPPGRRGGARSALRNRGRRLAVGGGVVARTAVAAVVAGAALDRVVATAAADAVVAAAAVDHVVAALAVDDVGPARPFDHVVALGADDRDRRAET